MGGRRRSRKSIQSTVGNILPYKDIRSKRDIPYALEQIKKGPVTLVLIYADWCGHCHTYKPDYEKSINRPNCSVQRMSIQDEMVPHMNEALQKLNSNQNSIKVEGYPTVQLLDNKGTLVKEIPRESVPNVVDTAGDLANVADANAISQANAAQANAAQVNAAQANATQANANASNANASNANAANANAANANAANVIDTIPTAAEVNAAEAADALDATEVETKPVVKAPIEPTVSSYTPFGTYLKGGLFKDYDNMDHNGVHIFNESMKLIPKSIRMKSLKKHKHPHKKHRHHHSRKHHKHHKHPRRPLYGSRAYSRQHV